MKKILDLLAGKKTYLVSAIYALCTFLSAIGVPVPGFESTGLIDGGLVAAGAAALRNSIK